LSESALTSVNESSRQTRFKVLAQQLNISESVLLTQLAENTGLSVLDEPAIDPNGIKILPARLANEAQIAPVLIPGSEEGRLNFRIFTSSR
jgi:AraC-like DNA-binding protein